MSAERPYFLPISHLNALEYCPRRFYYEFVLGEMLVNEHVLEGRLRHERCRHEGVGNFPVVACRGAQARRPPGVEDRAVGGGEQQVLSRGDPGGHVSARRHD